MQTISRFGKVSIPVLILLLLAVANAWGQGIVTGAITGTVADRSGAVVVNATITARSVDTNQQFTTSSNEAGVFLLPRIPPGTYMVTIEAPQFATVQISSVIVHTASSTQLGKIGLEIGAKTELVEVSGAAPLVESTTAQVTNTFETKAVTDLPVGRGIDQLTMYLPGISTAGSVGRGNNNGALFSANGQRPRSNNFQIDGQGMNDASVTGPAIFLENSDIVAEYQVLTHYDAAYGRNMGSQVNIITKKGTNAFHGTLVENYRGSLFDSLTNTEKSPIYGYCDPKNPEPGCEQPKVARHVRNMFGFTIGGPVVKDKAWFFGSGYWDRIRDAGAPITSGSLVTPTTNGIATLKQYFPNSPAVGYLQQFGPAVTTGGPTFSGLIDRNVTVGSVTVPVQFGTVSRNISSVTNVRQFSARFDWQLTDRDVFFARYLIDDEISTNLDYGDGAAGYVVDVPSRGQQIGLDWSHQFSNVFVNQARVNYTRLNVGFENGTTNCNRQDPSACPISIGFGDGTTLAMGLASNFPQGRLNNTYQLQDNASIVWGRHTLKFGGEYTWAKPFSDFLPNYNGVYSFSNFSNFIANTPSRLSLTDGPFRIRYSEKQVAWYIQDDWKVNDKLTLNLGLRWEWFQDTLNQLHNLSVKQQTGSNPFWNTALSLDRTTLPSIPEDLNNFGPIMGFAYSVHDKTVIRGGFRIAYDPMYYNIHLNVSTNAPFINAGVLTAGIDPTVPGLPTSGFLGADVRTLGLPYIPRGGDPGLRFQNRLAPNFHNPYSEQWNLGVAREISDRMAFEIRYLGNHTLGLFQQINGNPALNGLINAGFGSLIPAGMTPCSNATQPGYASGYVDCARRNVLTRTNTGFSIYHGMQTKFDVRSYHGLTGTVSYTWSHSIDNASDIYSTTGAGMLAISQNPFNYTSAERGSSNFDYRHVVGLQLIYDIPYQGKQEGWMGKLLGGWQASPTYRYASGQPYTPYQSKASALCDPTGTFSTTVDSCRPIELNPSAAFNTVGQITGITGGVPTVVLAGTTTPTTLNAVHWLVNNNYAATYLGSPFLGIGRNTFTGQPTHAMNFAMQKNTKITERVSFQLRATAFNVLNHQFLGVPGNRINSWSTSFGNWKYNAAGGGNANTLESGLSRRRLEFSGKIIF